MASNLNKVVEILEEQILEEKDLYVLRALFDIKLSVSTILLSTKRIHFDPSFLLGNESLDFSLVCDILMKVSKVCDEVDKLLNIIFKYITNNHSKVEYQLNVVKLLSCSVTMSKEYDKVDILFENLDPEFVYDILISALYTKIKPMAFETLVSYFKLFSKIVQIKCLNSVFRYSFENKNFEVFCALLNYIPKDYMYKENSCLGTHYFWLCIESCISGQESYLRKQAGYILSKCVANNYSESNPYLAVSNDYADSWQAFFILIDMGREKQLHLVVPSLNLLKYIYNLRFLWQKCVYKIYLEHSQTAIVYQVAIKVLKKEYSEDNLREIIKLVFQAINKNEYSDLSCDMFKTLNTFSAGLSKTKLEIVIKEFLQISWNVVSFWKVIGSLFVNNNVMDNIEIELLQEVLRYAGNLPHVFIRTECIKYLIKIFWDEKNYNKILKISSSLRSSDQYFQNCKFSEDIVHLILTDLNEEHTNLKIIKICFMILNNLKVDAWLYFEKELHTLNPHVLLFLWNNYLLSEKSIILYEQIGPFLYTYFQQHLHEETLDIFMRTVRALSSNYLLAADIIFQLVSETLFSPKEYSENQTYVAVMLIKDLLKLSCNDIKVNIKNKTGSVVICFFREDDNNVREIMVKDSRMSTACIDLIFTLHKNYSATDLIGIYTNMLESQDNSFLLDLYKKLFDLLILFSDCSDLVVNFIEVCHQNLQIIKRDQYYKRIVCEFIKVVYSDAYLKHGIANVNSINENVRQLSEAYPVVRLNWAKAIKELLCKAGPAYYVVCLWPIVDIYLQGAIISKDERTEFNLCQEIFYNIEQRSIELSGFVLGESSNPNLLTAASKLLSLEILLKIAKRDSELVFNCLNEKYMQHFKKRYFPDSKIHYEKLRIVQALLMLVLVVEISEEQTKRISSFVFNCLQEETNQNCVKQLFSWILVLVLKKASLAIEWIESRATTISPSILISILPAVYHLTLFGSEEVFEKTLIMVLPWTMGAQFKLRVYAQDLIRRILEQARRKKYIKLINQYKHLEHSIMSCIEATGDIFINTMKSDLPFINDFDPIRDKSLGTILYDIPRLNKVYPTEWQNMQFFIANPTLFKVNEILQEEVITSRQINCSFADAIDRFLDEDKSKVSEEDNLSNPILYNIQKKITPWKKTLENVTDTDAKIKTNFILIASLVDKSQNLGGLSRTCEVFGIRNISFNDAKIIQEKEFKSLSMSSEFWINASEVKVKELEEYILRLRSEGYCVVGAEQTAGSQKVTDFQFPRKMALLLGNEKTGIPPKIIPLLNVCLEIPQFGQTRSLNVHVAGALFIWEYAKQHLV